MSDKAAKTLVVAFNFPPFNDGSAATIAKRIIDADEPVDVIAADLSSVRSRDESLFALIEPWVNNVEYVRLPVEFATETGVRNFVTSGLAAATRLNGSKPYARLFSRSMWAHSHFLAAELKSRGVATAWTAEFSDPLLWQADASPRPSGTIADPAFMAHSLRAMSAREQTLLREQNSVLYWAQTVPYILADRLLFTNEQQFELMLGDAPPFMRDSVAGKSEISPHPTPEPIYYSTDDDASGQPYQVDGRRQQASTQKQGVFRIGYFGTFYPNRGGGDFLEALSLLAPDERNRIRLDVYSSGASSLLRTARLLGLRQNVRVMTPLPYRAFLRATQDYDALLVNDIATTPFGMPSPFLPSKYSDYAGSTTPIMAVTIPGSPLDERGARRKVHVGMIDDLAAILRAL